MEENTQVCDPPKGDPRYKRFTMYNAETGKQFCTALKRANFKSEAELEAHVAALRRVNRERNAAIKKARDREKQIQPSGGHFFRSAGLDRNLIRFLRQVDRTEVSGQLLQSIDLTLKRWTCRTCTYPVPPVCQPVTQMFCWGRYR